MRGDEAAAILARALVRGTTWLDPHDVHSVLACHGLPFAPQRIVCTPTAAAHAAAELGGPVALKAIVPGLLHKSDEGAVAVGLAGPTAVRRAAQEMRTTFTENGHAPEGFIAQAMAPPGVELLVGATVDPLFGPVVACGAGGQTVELLHDVAVRLAPLTDRDAHEMLRELRTFPLPEGYRGKPPVDLVAVEDVVLRVGALVDAHPEIVELDCNPVIAGPAGAIVVDARVRVAPTAPPDPELRS